MTSEMLKILVLSAIQLCYHTYEYDWCTLCKDQKKRKLDKMQGKNLVDLKEEFLKHTHKSGTNNKPWSIRDLENHE